MNDAAIVVSIYSDYQIWFNSCLIKAKNYISLEKSIGRKWLVVRPEDAANSTQIESYCENRLPVTEPTFSANREVSHRSSFKETK